MVLIINASKKRAQAVSDIFYYMGVLSYGATPQEALSEISDLYRAIIILDPDNLPDTENYIQKIRSYSSVIPIFAVHGDSKDSRPDGLFDAHFNDSICSSTLVQHIVRYQIHHKLPLSAHYRLAGIDASCDSARVNVFDKPIDFTKTETMILRYLIATYPLPQNAKSIIKYAFKPLKKPEITSIRTHISVMNRKFRKITGKGLFISLPTQGYIISTPEILKAYPQAN